ncbi:type II toxin-antitoxin system RelE/ParE family toxin [bacterium]|nr:type II toxin-antitoxin system RelE/ParE family toxin [bacterium]
MIYHLETTTSFNKQFKKLDRFTQKQIKEWLMKHIEGTTNPRNQGKGLVSNRSGQWRYRIGNYRVIVNINDNTLLILGLEVGHRRDIY